VPSRLPKTTLSASVLLGHIAAECEQLVLLCHRNLAKLARLPIEPRDRGLGETADTRYPRGRHSLLLTPPGQLLDDLVAPLEHQGERLSVIAGG
jgi:hypothetical protein